LFSEPDNGFSYIGIKEAVTKSTSFIGDPDGFSISQNCISGLSYIESNYQYVK
jgi:hypothetical protein